MGVEAAVGPHRELSPGTIRQRASLRDLIEAIPEEDWTPDVQRKSPS